MNTVISFLVFILSSAISFLGFSQTLIINPNTDGGFELGNSFAANGWTEVNNGVPATGNNWYLTSNTLTSSSYSFAPTGNKSAYISQNANGTWTYNFNQYSTTHLFKDVSFPAGQDSITMKFRWNGFGEGPIYDVLYIYSCPTSLTPIAGVPTGTSSNTAGWQGSGISQLHATIHSSPNLNGNVAEITLPASFAGTNRRLVFTWKNGSTLGNQPPAAIDSVFLFSDCKKAHIAIQNNSTNCSGNISLLATVSNPAGTFQWYVNNVPIAGATNALFQSSAIASGSTVHCIYTMNNVCNYKDTADALIQFGMSFHGTDTIDICSGSLPINWRGTTIPDGATTSQNYATITVAAPGGCDSIISLFLYVRPTPPPQVETLVVCRNQLPSVWRGHPILSHAQSNSKYDSIRVPSPVGCDSLIYLNLIVQESGELVSNTINDCKPISFNGTVYSSSTVVYDTLFDVAGCDSIIYKTLLIIKPFDLSLTSSLLRYLEGETVLLETSSNSNSYSILSWSPSNLFPNQNRLKQSILGPLDEQIQVIGENNIGCKDTATMRIIAVIIDPTWDIPNAFSPNGDGKNEVFKPVLRMNSDYSIVQFVVYNRWGKVVYNAVSGDGSAAWDGRYSNGMPADNGVYFYKIKIRFLDRSEVSKAGEVHLIR